MEHGPYRGLQIIVRSSGFSRQDFPALEFPPRANLGVEDRILRIISHPMYRLITVSALKGVDTRGRDVFVSQFLRIPIHAVSTECIYHLLGSDSEIAMVYALGEIQADVPRVTDPFLAHVQVGGEAIEPFVGNYDLSYSDESTLLDTIASSTRVAGPGSKLQLVFRRNAESEEALSKDYRRLHAAISNLSVEISVTSDTHQGDGGTQVGNGVEIPRPEITDRQKLNSADAVTINPAPITASDPDADLSDSATMPLSYNLVAPHLVQATSDTVGISVGTDRAVDPSTESDREHIILAHVESRDLIVAAANVSTKRIGSALLQKYFLTCENRLVSTFIDHVLPQRKRKLGNLTEIFYQNRRLNNYLLKEEEYLSLLPVFDCWIAYCLKEIAPATADIFAQVLASRFEEIRELPACLERFWGLCAHVIPSESGVFFDELEEFGSLAMQLMVGRQLRDAVKRANESRRGKVK